MQIATMFEGVIDEKNFMFEDSIRVRYRIKIDGEIAEFSTYYSKQETMTSELLRERALASVKSQIDGLKESIDFCSKKKELLEKFVKENTPVLSW